MQELGSLDKHGSNDILAIPDQEAPVATEEYVQGLTHSIVQGLETVPSRKPPSRAAKFWVDLFNPYRFLILLSLAVNLALVSNDRIVHTL